MVILAALVVAGQAAAGAYVLRPGDTLTGVAARNRVSVTDLAQANGISNPDRVLAGTSLRIPGGPATAGTPVAGAGPTSNYVVKAGDNLETLARRFGTTSKALAAANGVRNPDLVVIGTKLKLPAPGAGVPLPARLRRDPARVALLPRFDYWARVYGLPPDLLPTRAGKRYDETKRYVAGVTASRGQF